jgi:hypothetical protein
VNKLIEYVLIAVALAAAAWWFDDDLREHYQAPLIAAHKEAIKAQKDTNDLAVKELATKKSKANIVYIDRIKEVEIYAKTLSKDAACLADPEFVRLYNAN